MWKCKIELILSRQVFDLYKTTIAEENDVDSKKTKKSFLNSLLSMVSKNYHSLKNIKNK